MESDFYKIFNADKFELLMSKYYLTGALTLLIFNIIFEEKIRNTFITFSNVSEDYEIIFIWKSLNSKKSGGNQANYKGYMETGHFSR